RLRHRASAEHRPQRAMPRGFPPAAHKLDRPEPRSQGCSIPGLLRNLALKILAVLRASEIMAILHHHLTPQDRHDRPGKDVVALPGGVVGLVQICGAYLAAPCGIEDRDVGIALKGDGSFPWIEAHNLGGIA